MVHKANGREASVDFVITSVPESSSHLKRQDILCVITLCSLALGETDSVDDTTFVPICTYTSTGSDVISREK